MYLPEVDHDRVTRRASSLAAPTLECETIDATVNQGRPFPRCVVPVRVLARFPPTSPGEWARGHQATTGKRLFLEHFPGAVDASGTLVREWLSGLGHEFGSRWVSVDLEPGLPRRWVNLGFSDRCVDAFVRGPDDSLEAIELKPTARDGIAGLTLSEERLLRAGHIRVFHVHVTAGLIGEADPQVLLAVPRRLDGIPVGEAVIEWLDTPDHRRATRALATSSVLPQGAERPRRAGRAATKTALVGESGQASQRKRGVKPAAIQPAGATSPWSALVEQLTAGFELRTNRDKRLRPWPKYGPVKDHGHGIGEVQRMEDGTERLWLFEPNAKSRRMFTVTSSQTWKGGYCEVTNETVEACRAALEVAAATRRRATT